MTCAQIGFTENAFREGHWSLSRKKLQNNATSLVPVVVMMENFILIKLYSYIAICIHCYIAS